MPSTPQLSDQQLAFLRVLWDLGEATSQDVHQALADTGQPLAPTTVATVLGRLERRGLVAHRTRGRQYVYRARVTEPQVRRSMLVRLTDYFFGGDTAALASHLAGDEGVGATDLEEVRKLIAEREAQEESNG